MTRVSPVTKRRLMSALNDAGQFLEHAAAHSPGNAGLYRSEAIAAYEAVQRAGSPAERDLVEFAAKRLSALRAQV